MKVQINIPEQIDIAIRDYQILMKSKGKRKPSKSAVIDALLLKHQETILGWIDGEKTRAINIITSFEKLI